MDRTDKKITIGIFNDSFPPTIDGVANAALNYARELKKSGDEPIVATPYYPQVEDAFDFEVVRYHSFDTVKEFGYRTGDIFDPMSTKKLLESNMQLIHVHCPIISCYYARMLREQLNIPIILTYHTKYDTDIAKAIANPLIQNAAKKLLLQNIEACDEVWAVSKGAAENLKSLGYRGSIEIMENGADIPRGRSDRADCAKLRGQLGLSDEFVFLFVGRMMWYKGIDLILHALEKMKAGPYKMVFVGNGKDKEEIVAEAKRLRLAEKVIFVDGITDRELLKVYYSMADIFIFPSTFDTNGLVVSEAAACSLPSVLIENSAAAERITHKRNGYLIKEDADALKQMMEYAMEHAEEVRKVGENAEREVYLSWEEAVEKAAIRYRQVIEKYRNQPIHKESRLREEALRFMATIQSGAADLHIRRKLIREKSLHKRGKIQGEIAQLRKTIKTLGKERSDQD